MVKHHPTKFKYHRHCSSRNIMVFVCHVISDDEIVMWIYRYDSIKANYNPAKCGGQRHCGSLNITFLVVRGQDFTCPCLYLPLLFIPKAQVMPCPHT